MGSMKAQSELAGRAAAAKDKHFTADYALTRGDQDPVPVSVSIAGDGTWSVAVPGGASGGQADVTIAWNRQGYFQCVQGRRVVCTDIAREDGSIPGRYDPRVQHVFTDWLDILRDRDVPVSVAYTKALPGAGKESSCYSLERNSVAVAVPIPASVYCLRADGTITAVRSDFGTLRLSGEPAAAAANTKLPGDVVDDTPLSTAPPPKPTPTKTPKPHKTKTGQPKD